MTRGFCRKRERERKRGKCRVRVSETPSPIARDGRGGGGVGGRGVKIKPNLPPKVTTVSEINRIDWGVGEQKKGSGGVWGGRRRTETRTHHLHEETAGLADATGGAEDGNLVATGLSHGPGDGAGSGGSSEHGVTFLLIGGKVCVCARHGVMRDDSRDHSKKKSLRIRVPGYPPAAEMILVL